MFASFLIDETSCATAQNAQGPTTSLFKRPDLAKIWDHVQAFILMSRGWQSCQLSMYSSKLLVQTVGTDQHNTCSYERKRVSFYT